MALLSLIKSMILRLESSSLALSLPQHQPQIGNLIRSLRQLVGHRQEQFAIVLGVSFSTLNRWENGHIQPSPLALRQVERVLAQLSQSSDPTLQEGSKALLAKYGSASS